MKKTREKPEKNLQFKILWVNSQSMVRLILTMRKVCILKEFNVQNMSKLSKMY
jgi:hypothetical protein